MDLKQLRQFCEVCERGSFSGAGESLYMTQQAVGKSMKLLEEELGVILFIRDKSGVVLTPQGEYLKDRCKYLLDYVKETEDQIQQIGANCPLRTKIAIVEGLAEHMKLHAEEEASALLQAPFIEPVLLPADECEEAVLEEKAGAAISVSQRQDERLQVYPLLNIPLCIAMSDQEKPFLKKEMTLKDFRQKTIILLSGWERVNDRLLRAFKEQNVKPDGVLYVNSLKEGIKAARQGKGLFLLARRDFNCLMQKGVHAVPVKIRSFSINLYYVFRKEDACQKELIRIYEFLKIRLLGS